MEIHRGVTQGVHQCFRGWPGWRCMESVLASYMYMKYSQKTGIGSNDLVWMLRVQLHRVSPGWAGVISTWPYTRVYNVHLAFIAHVHVGENASRESGLGCFSVTQCDAKTSLQHPLCKPIISIPLFPMWECCIWFSQMIYFRSEILTYSTHSVWFCFMFLFVRRNPTWGYLYSIC